MTKTVRVLAAVIAAAAIASVAPPAQADGGGSVTPMNHWCC